MLSVWPYFLAYLFPAAMFLGLWLGGWGCYLGFVFVFMLTPLIDSFSGFNTAEPEETPGPLYAWIPRLWLPVQLAVSGTTLWVMVHGQLETYEFIGLILSLGLVTGGGGITVAHELMHRPGPFDRGLAEILMGLSNYWHFCIEHVYGHHRNVATPLDPGTARRGENLYLFLPRTLIGSARSAWEIEAKRCERQKISAFSLKNRRLRYVLGTILANLGVTLWLGPVGLLGFIGQSVVAIILLETVNYIEHYGLERELQDNGRYERVQPRHSWNSAHRFTSYILFNLPRHADHHANASRPYATLRHMDNSPQMPAGYATMILAAFVPPLWFWIMDPRVEQNKQQQELALAAV